MCRLLLATLLVIVTGAPLPVAAQSLVGAWRQVEIEVMGGPNAGVTDVEDNGSLWVFSDRYHSLNVVGPNANRPEPGDSWTTEEMAELFQAYVAFAGTYELDGSNLTLQADVTWNPGQERTLTPEITLTETTLETRGTGPDGVVTARRYVRVD